MIDFFFSCVKKLQKLFLANRYVDFFQSQDFQLGGRRNAGAKLEKLNKSL